MIQRYNAPEVNNKFYLNTAGGGYNRCIKISGFSVLPNCVGYAYGRFMEAGNVTACTLSAGDAENWWDYPDGYQRGQEPKPGAVVCWRKGAAHYGEDGRGHVEFVEQVNPDGSIITTGSNYGGTRWYRHTRSKPYTISGQTFQGFIYNPYIVETIIPAGASDQELNGHRYNVYRQGQAETFAVLSAGLNKLNRIQDLNADVWVMAKVTGANYFQMKTGQPDPVGTTYGDISAPLNDVWRELPNQNTTLYFDYETGAFGDCTGIKIDPTHNVASPAVVYPKAGNYQYARMVGINHVNTRSRYTFAVRFTDGRYIVGITDDEMTPKEIAADFRPLPDFESIQFFDGGGSAQMGRWNGKTFEYVRDTGRAVPSAFAIISTTPYKPENEPTTDETQKDEEQTMIDDTIENQPIFEPIKDEDWTDPEPTADTTGEIILKRFLSVKSFVTLTLTGVFSYLSLTGKITQEQFMSVFTMCISFFFGYSFEKKTNQK